MSEFTHLKLFKNWKFINYQLVSVLIKEYIYITIHGATLKTQRFLNCEPCNIRAPQRVFTISLGNVFKDEFSFPVNRNLSRWYLFTVLRAVRRRFKFAINWPENVDCKRCIWNSVSRNVFISKRAKILLKLCLANQQSEQTSLHCQQNPSGVTTATSSICYLG
jgi:hypothetical protein